ncbi:hypothetical protein QBC34DRAFT_194704 [Podospora aff. communis PSN243]|uniref:PHD-type domain-containing protein n=1 Tax=Podospora aff. communis PSN243 TaxID=3040156 RepID=A0AAV9GYQ3_9PEZI|nr:hypothetical protein QBC34DRAFT_194704 [Podospora aff. communis PSN243]
MELATMQALPKPPRLPHCRRCKGGQEKLKPLHQCSICFRSYHSACHSPYPDPNNKNWICASCEKRLPLDTRYNEGLSRSQSVYPHTGMTRVSQSRSSTVNPTSTSASSMARPTQGQAPPMDGAGGGAGPVRSGMRCSMPSCSATITPNEVFCAEHQSFTSGTSSAPTSRSTSASAPTRQPHQQQLAQPPVHLQPQPQRTSSSLDRQPQPAALKNKLLAENDKSRPMTLRKTAVSKQTFNANQPSAKQPALSPLASVADPAEMKTTALHSSAPPVPVSASHAIPRHPVNGEPPRKRSRTTPNSAASPEPRPIGTEMFSSAAVSSTSTGTKHERLAAAPHKDTSRSSSASSSFVARPSGRQAATFKRSSASKTVRQPVRKMAPNSSVSVLYPSHGNEAGPQPAERLSESPKVRWDGVAITTERRDSNRDLSPSKNVHSYWELSKSGNFERRTLPTAQLSKPPAHLPNGYSSHEPERNRTDDRCNLDALPRTFAELRAELKATFATGANAQRPLEQPKGALKTKTIRSPLVLPTKPVPQNRKVVDESFFDNVVYRQDGAATPPPQVRIPASPAGSVEAIKAAEPLPPDEPFYADIDPRIHWPQPHSEAWMEAKQNEIEMRGRRKAKFGKAAQRIREQRLLEETKPLDDAVPEKVRRDPTWLRVWKQLHGGTDQVAEAPIVPAGNGNGNGNGNGAEPPRRGRKPGPKKQASQANGLTNGNVNGHANGYVNGLTNGCGSAGATGGGRS